MIQTTESECRALVAKLRRFLDEKVSDIDFIRLDPFRLVRLGPAKDNETDMFVKEAISLEGDDEGGKPRAPTSVTFKCVFIRKFAQAIKTYFQREINEMDRTYVDSDGRFHVMPADELWRRLPAA